MKRTQIYLDADQDRAIARRATSAGTTKSKVIREAIESYLTSAADDAARLAEFRAAIDVVENAPAALSDGRSYVEDLRAADRVRDDVIERRRG